MPLPLVVLGDFAWDVMIRTNTNLLTGGDTYGEVMLTPGGSGANVAVWAQRCGLPTGFIGKTGRGSIEHCGVMGRVDIITSTLGKAMGGASGGFTSGRKEIVEWLRQRSRPYLFSNSLAPSIVAASLRVLDMLEGGAELRARLRDNAEFFRTAMTNAGFTLAGAGHPIIPVMIGDAALAASMADELLKRGIYVIGFSFPVVPRGEARIRTQMSAAHSRPQLEQAVTAFTEVGRELGVIA